MKKTDDISRRACRAALVNLLSCDFLPTPVSLALGYIKAYADKRLKGRAQIELFQCQLSQGGDIPFGVLPDVLAFQPDIVGISCFHWNIIQTAEFVEELRKAGRKIFIVLGGPEATGQGRTLLENSAADAVIAGEGEITFTELIEAVAEGRPPQGLDGTFVRTGRGIIAGKPREFIGDLNIIPSAYLSGVCPFPTGPRVMLMLETSRGCPMACAFCAWTYKSQQVRCYSMDRVRAEIDWIVSKAASAGGPDTTILTSDADIFMDRERGLGILRHIRKVSPSNIHWVFQTDMGRWDKEMIRIANHKCLKFCVGVGSINARTLKKANRPPCDCAAILKKTRMFRRHAPRAHFSLQFMIGMPGDTLKTFKKSVDWGWRENLCDFFRTQVFHGTHYRMQAAGFGLRYGGPPLYFVESCRGFPKRDIDRANRMAFGIAFLFGSPSIRKGLRRLAAERYDDSVSRAFLALYSKFSRNSLRIINDTWRECQNGGYLTGLWDWRIDAGSRRLLAKESAAHIDGLMTGGPAHRGRAPGKTMRK